MRREKKKQNSHCAFKAILLIVNAMKSKHFREKYINTIKKNIAKKVNRGNERQLPAKLIPTVIYFNINKLSTKGNRRKPTSNFFSARFI